MPCYPALALLLGSAMATDSDWVRRGTRALAVIAACAAIAAFAIYWSWSAMCPTPGDISSALVQHPKAYTLSLGHMEDLTLASFAYLRLPLLLAGIAFLVGALGTFARKAKRAFLAIRADDGAVLPRRRAGHGRLRSLSVFAAAGGSAAAIARRQLIVERHYYPFSSVFFYTNRTALLLNGRVLNLEYGSYAPGAADVFIDDAELKNLWRSADAIYLVCAQTSLPRLKIWSVPQTLNIVAPKRRQTPADKSSAAQPRPYRRFRNHGLVGARASAGLPALPRPRQSSSRRYQVNDMQCSSWRA